MGAIQMVVDEQADLRLNYVADKIQIKIIKLTPQQQLKQNQNLVYCLESDPVAAGETNQALCFECGHKRRLLKPWRWHPHAWKCSQGALYFCGVGCAEKSISAVIDCFVYLLTIHIII